MLADFVWQLRQTALRSATEFLVFRVNMTMSPCSSAPDCTCVLAGPWHRSQPSASCLSRGCESRSAPLLVDANCWTICLWHSAHVFQPAYPGGSAAFVVSFGCSGCAGAGC